jgi:hypothetical protein
MAAAAGVTSMGPAVIVSGCLSGTNHKDSDKATEFALHPLASATSLTQDPAPEGVTEFRVVGIVPDLQRHADEEVEIIGTIVEAAPAGPTLTLDAKSIRTRADACSR